MILFFDTETTGLPMHSAAPGHPSQPHIVQLAAILTDDEGREASSISLIVNPGVPIPAEASEIHGITDEIAALCGVKESHAAGIFAALLLRADVLVAHNIAFDIALMRSAFARHSPAALETAMPPMICTMELASPVMNLPPTRRMVAAGYNKPKPPRLSECIEHFFGEELAGAHDALIDVRACARVYWHLHSLKSAA